MKPVLACLFQILAIALLIHNTMEVTRWMLPPLLAAFYGVYGLAFLLTNSLSKDDTLMLPEVERKRGVNMTAINAIRWVLSRFM